MAAPTHWRRRRFGLKLRTVPYTAPPPPPLPPRPPRGTLKLPAVRQVELTAPLTWLALGWRDLWRCGSCSLVHGLLMAVFGLLLLWLAGDRFWLLAGAFSGFLVVAPVLATSLYALSRALERGEPAGWRTIRKTWTRWQYSRYAVHGGYYPVKIRGHLVRRIEKYAAAPGAQGQSPDTLCRCQGQDASYALYPPAADFLFIHFSCRSPKVYGRRRDDSGLAGRPEKSTVGASEDFYERRKDHAARAVHTLAPPVLFIIGKSLFP